MLRSTGGQNGHALDTSSSRDSARCRVPLIHLVQYLHSAPEPLPEYRARMLFHPDCQNACGSAAHQTSHVQLRCVPKSAHGYHLAGPRAFNQQLVYSSASPCCCVLLCVECDGTGTGTG